MQINKLICAALAIVGAFTAGAQDADYGDMPEVTKFYPGARPENPIELKPTTKAYIYFTAGAEVLQCKANIRQGTQMLGTVIYEATTTKNVCLMDPSKEANSAIADIPEGDFDLEFYYLEYVSEGVTKTYDKASSPYSTVTYHRAGNPGVVVAETGLEDKLIKSYYPVGGAEGVKTYTFSKPLLAEGINCYLAYGGNDIPHMLQQAFSLSDDAMTITIDFRGKCNNVDALAPGVTFVDEMGNPCDPPTTISLVVSGLKCADGTTVQTTSVSLDGTRTTMVTGEVYQAFNYLDITFPNPAITNVQFFDSAAPTVTYAAINDDTDMMQVCVGNVEYIASADIELSNGAATEVIAYADCVKDAAGFVAQIPATFKSLGSSNLVVSLINAAFVSEDGAEHVILPYAFEHKTKEVLSLAEMLQLPEGTPLVLNVTDGVIVTFAADAGYTFMEDATAGVMVVTEDYANVLTEGSKLIGKIAGTYQGNSTFMIDPANSDYVEALADVRTGVEIEDVAQLLGGDCDYRLVTIIVGEALTARYDASVGYLLIDDAIPVVTDFVEGYALPEGTVKSVTGVYCPDLSEMPMLLVRTADDIVVEPASSINDVNADVNDDHLPVYNLKGMRIDPKTAPRGFYIKAKR